MYKKVYALIGITIAVLAIVVGVICFAIKQSNIDKKPNPAIKLMAKTFTLVPIKKHYSHHSWVAFKNAQEFIAHAPKSIKGVFVYDEGNHAPKSIKGVFVYDEGNHIFYFYHLRGYDFCIELPKMVKA